MHDKLYITIFQSAYCNESGVGINYDSDSVIYPTREDAIECGLVYRGSDDFNIGVIENRKLVSLDWMNEVVDNDPKLMKEIEEELYLKWWIDK